ncbi:glycosyltransferase family 4 protein [Salmonella enterica subsp. enterica]|nr:glycosyltransferase family 4 protein [Salmonella enterica]EBF8815590.1 glycosyltransferase family 4 protein [Salmonella enterica subsp. enterica]EGN0547073.1 glycosyltransferase family 4 protein [Salmonella enterica subsp. enterica serovar Adelaide]EHC35001.1 Putative glycosyl transferase [Salmonella enterica subsp. enterica serovar Adelaide str. A4-669]EIS5206771.1 glycosyltransferase family 4 protein [Salmonella enterica]
MLRFRKELIINLVSQGDDVYCLANDFSPEDLKLLSSWGGKGIKYTLNSKGINPFKDILSVIELKNILDKISPDIVFSYFVKPVIFGTIASKLSRVPRIVGMIEGLGNAFTYYKGKQSIKTRIIKWMQIFLYKLALPMLNDLVLLNKDDKKDLIERYNIKVNVTILGGIGLNLNDFSYKEPLTDKVTFIFIARLLREKGVFEYIEAAKRVKNIYPNVEFVILGGFENNNPFSLQQHEIELLRKEHDLIYPGHVENVQDWLEKSSVFVLPTSYREGVPRVIQEAMAIGRPVITTNVPGCKDIINDGINGFLVPPFESELLVKKMIYFIDNRSKILEMGLSGRLFAEKNFDAMEKNKTLASIIKANHEF